MEKFDQSALSKASFAGVSFYVEKQQETQSMKAVKHQLLGVDGLIIKQLGLGEQIIKVPAYIVGEDYLDKLKDLKEVLASKKVSKLVLPFDFSEDAICESLEVNQDFVKAGAAFLDIVFAVGKEAKSLQVELDNSFDFKLQSEKVKDLNILKMLRKFSVEGFDSKQIKDLNNKLNEIKGVKSQVESFEFSQLFLQSAAFSANILSFVDSFNKVDYSDEVDKVSTQLNTITEMAKTDNIINSAAKVESIKSYNEAIEFQNNIIVEINNQLDYLEKTNQITLLEDDMYILLKNFKEVFISYNEQLSIKLPNLTKYTNTIARPTVLIAYDIADGDIEKLETVENDIIIRNNIKITSIVPEQELEVLNV